MKHYLAIDLGGDKGRVSVGSFDGRHLSLKEISRFDNSPVQVMGTIYWDLLNVFRCISEAISSAKRTYGPSLRSLGIDSWGGDFGLLGEDGRLLKNLIHYRDPSSAGMFDEVYSRVPKGSVFAETGVPFSELNSLCQLLAISLNYTALYQAADRLLFVPDMLNYWLTGKMAANRTIASASQFYNPVTKDWAHDLLAGLGLREDLFAELVDPCTILGQADELSVVNVGSHDTASAFAAVPMRTGARCAFISSGAWSSVGAELDEPVIEDAVKLSGFANEVGICNTIRFIKCIPGLWILQELRRMWHDQGHNYSWQDMDNLVSAAIPHGYLIDPSAEVFRSPENMELCIKDFCEQTGQGRPEDHGSILRAAYDGLALLYADTFNTLKDLTGKEFDLVRIVGGGSKNILLNQLTANAIGLPVISGPMRAKAIGNVIGQMIAMGDIDSLAEGREIIRNSFSFESRVFSPRDATDWAIAMERWHGLFHRSV
ncbi:MAG TPA: rhamnulokinase family protein [Pontiella sp.]